MSRAILRKRKRSAVDPCLGYYAEQQEVVEVQTVALPTIVNSRPALHTAPPQILAVDQTVKPRARKSRQLLTTEAPDLEKGNLFISVEGFLRGNARASSRRGRAPTTTGNPTFVRLGQREDESGHESRLPFDGRELSPIEFEVSPLRPQSAMDWAFDIKAPLASGGILGQDEYEELHSEQGSLPEIAVLDSGSISQDAESPPPLADNTLRLRTRNIPRQDLLDSSESGSQSEANTTDSDLGNSTSPAKHKRKKGKNGKVRIKSLGARLFEAGVATHGKPMDSLVVPPQAVRIATGDHDFDSERKPLPFVPVEGSPEVSASASLVVNRKHFLVDPHCIEPFRTAYFGPPMKHHGTTSPQAVVSKTSQPSSIVYRTLSDWQPKLDEKSFKEPPSQKQVRDRRKRGLRKEGQAPPEIAYAPLEFVPLSEALSSRKNRQSHRVSIENRIV